MSRRVWFQQTSNLRVDFVRCKIEEEFSEANHLHSSLSVGELGLRYGAASRDFESQIRDSCAGI